MAGLRDRGRDARIIPKAFLGNLHRLSDIPDEWCESIGKQGLDILFEEIESNLMRCNSDEFWSVLQ
ncbi:HipA family kinase [Ectopseudomonas oleovorans]|uniref:HipA family kinase n=1 Tax=Ectopseudomonas oleovorans TaxID=301 RepID=UPI0034CFE21C